MIARVEKLQTNLDRILGTIVEQFDPEKVIVFGSLPAGRVREWSDLDVAVIYKTDEPYFRRLRALALACDYDVGVDFFPFTPEEFDAEARANPFVRDEILAKGRVVYERGAD